ncbi:hypothetical protein HYT45_02785 [Candidatus Uhrbacteria bacterium]|nr:hypothetical protein [Candidatus Uhrbacteria bacterium]
MESSASEIIEIWYEGLVAGVHKLLDCAKAGIQSDIQNTLFPVWAETAHKIVSRHKGHACAPCAWTTLAPEEQRRAFANKTFSFENFAATALRALSMVLEKSAGQH